MNDVQRQRAHQIGWLIAKETTEVGRGLIALTFEIGHAVVALFARQHDEYNQHEDRGGRRPDQGEPIHVWPNRLLKTSRRPAATPPPRPLPVGGEGVRLSS